VRVTAVVSGGREYALPPGLIPGLTAPKARLRLVRIGD
jgi:hypothetical protein